MDLQNEKCVMVIDEHLPPDIIANTAKMENVSESTLQYFGLAICGPKKRVNKLTGSMSLLR